MGEFVEGFEELAGLGPAVTVFGSARVNRDDEAYATVVEVGRLLGEAGFAIITGGDRGSWRPATAAPERPGQPPWA